ncbi:lytic transglycosylase domain-containing protein [Antrihabitans cavernicola]|uniref:Murein transglycosylase n=1 Tax=Antrihabitans cavernicola TaxID=2495913 RepID=A0A5A7SB94_9NOCA|nr:lytic murein transglycosylase [Spelaeibacter cavernicola]KAA0022569.1 murein transglycosylase [Spelaeibacter cavernicola]
MGRHSKTSNSTARRNTLIALSGLVPAGLVTAVSTAGATPEAPVVSQAADAHDVSAAVPLAQTSPGSANIADAATPAALLAAAPAPAPVAPPAPTGPQLPTSIAESPIGVPTINVAAYKAAEHTLAVQNPNCHMPWNLIAGIGRVESTQANDGKVDAAGNMLDPIYGPILDGSLGGNNVVMDTDGGALDGNATYDRAVGPMQFLPETWKKYGADGNGDGKIDPQNIFDAALTTGKYLCDGNLDMRDLAQQSKAILRYNNSMAYVANVMAWSLGYATGVVPAADALPRI